MLIWLLCHAFLWTGWLRSMSPYGITWLCHQYPVMWHNAENWYDGCQYDSHFRYISRSRTLNPQIEWGRAQEHSSLDAIGAAKLCTSNGAPLDLYNLADICVKHDDVIKWKHFPRYWPFVQRPATRSFDVFFDLHLIKRLSKQSWGWWFETPLRSLWRHCNGKGFNNKGDIFSFNSVLITCCDQILWWDRKMPRIYIIIQNNFIHGKGKYYRCDEGKRFPRNWTWRGSHRSMVDSPQEGPVTQFLMLIYVSQN